MAAAELIAELVEVVARCAPAAGAAWLRAQLGEPAKFAAAFAGAARRLGTAPAGEVALAIPWSSASSADECGRAALLLAVIGERDADALIVRDLVRRGDVRERQAVLRALAGLTGPERFVELAVDACRTNVQSVFEAIACDNAFPARYFPDAAFNQLALKALFIGAPVARIVDLSSRVTGELVRMVDAYASERRAAGRPIPDDAALFRRNAT